MAGLFKKSIFWTANPMLVVPLVFAFHSSTFGWHFPHSGLFSVSDVLWNGGSRTATLFKLSSSLESDGQFSLVATLSPNREIKRIHFLGLGSKDQAWSISELNQGVTIQAPRGEFSGPHGEFGMIHAANFSATHGGELDLDFPGTLEQGVLTRTRLQVSFDSGKWVVYPVSDGALRAAWSEGLNNRSIVVN